LGDSILPVKQSAAIGPVDTRRPFISRTDLQAKEAAASMVIELPLKMRNFAELEARVAKGERISAQEMKQKYEPAAQDYQAVIAWAKGQGLTIVRQDDHRLAVFARGSVSQIASAFGVQFARVTYRGKEYTSAISTPSISANLGGLLVGVNGLQPHLRPHPHFVRKQTLAHPANLTGSAEYYPNQIAQAYNISPLYNGSVTGSGQTIAIVIDTFPATGDLLQFWQAAGVKQSLSRMHFIQTVPGQLSTPSGEETLDTEWASSMAPGADVRVYAATDLANIDLDTSYQRVLDDATNHPEDNIHQMVMCYGSGESDSSDSQLNTDHQLFVSLTAAGVTCFASAGDGGSTPDDNGGEYGSLEPEAPASDPNVTGVGGTSLILNSNNSVSSETVWNDGASGGSSGGGTSLYFPRPTWQTGTGVNLNAYRQVPDIAATADPNYGGVVVLNGQTTVFGGTSLACPICGAICSLVNQVRTNAGLSVLGFLNPNLYSNIGTAAFRDITSGNNYTPNSPTQYAATVGYDECTGLGVPQGLSFVEALGSSTPYGIQFPNPLVEVTPGATATFSATAGGGSATYQWQCQSIGTTGWSNLSNSGTYTGSATATLTITGATTAMSGDQFRCIVQLPSTTITTNPPSNLAVETPQPVSNLAGDTGQTGTSNGSGTSANFNYPSGVALDSSNNLYVADYSNNQIRKISTSGAVSTPFGSLTIGPDGKTPESGSSNGSGNNATFNNPNGLAIDASNNIYVADSGNNLIRKITGTIVSTFAGADGSLNDPQGVAVDPNSGNVYVADAGNHVIRKITPGGSESILAGQSGTSGYQDGTAGQALFNDPQAVAVDASGNVWVADFGNAAIREISSGTVTTVAGGGQGGYIDGRASSAQFSAPTGLAFDSLGNLFITDSQVPELSSIAAGNCLLRKLSPSGVVTTVAGNPGVAGSTSGTGTGAEFYSIQAVVCAYNGVYVADTYNQLIRTVGAPKKQATITLGNLSLIYDGSPQSATATTNPTGLAVTFTYDGSSTAPTDTGSYTVVGTINDTVYAGTATATLTIAQATQTISFSPSNQVYPASGPITLFGMASSGLALTYSLISGPATESNNQITLTGTGTVIVEASQPGDSNYLAATSVTGTFVVGSSEGFSDWEDQYFTSGQQSDPNTSGLTATPENDGTTNMLKYLADIDPASPMDPDDRAALPTLQLDSSSNPGTTYLALAYRQYAYLTNVTVSLETSPDLQTWTAVAPAISRQVGTDATTGDPIMEMGVVAPASGKEFLRLQITSP
jgi:kumamolisin